MSDANDPMKRQVPVERLEPAFPASPLYRRVTEQAERIRAERDRILEEARQEASRIRAEAEEDVRRRGLEATRDAEVELRAELGGLVRTLREELIAYRDDLDARMEHAALQMARHATDVEFGVRPGTLASFVRTQIERHGTGYDHVRLHVHPDVARILDDLDDVEIIRDPEMPVGAVRIETEVGDFLKDVHEAFDQISERLFTEPP